MSTETIFFSYSRDNSEFVMQLANELRAAGANVWMDQLDIKAGTRWDRSIEKALISSNVLLVILSNSSVDSNNVMDEVSFALEEGKTIVPVLLEKCTVPFRLRRLQFADFTGEYEKGIKSLIHALNLEHNIASKLITGDELEKQVEVVDVPKKTIKQKKKEVSTPIQTKERENPIRTSPKVNSKKSNKKTLAIAVALIAIVAICAWIFFGTSEDEKNWKEVLSSNSLEVYEAHLQNFDECMHEDEANKKIAAIIETEKDNSDWIAIKSSLDLIDFDNHLETFPDCPHTNDVNNKIAVLADKIKEKNAWDKAIESKTEIAINAYKNAYPKGTYIRQANVLLSKLSSERAAWNTAVRSNSVASYTNFLKEHPESTYSDQANAKLNTINAASTRKRDIDHWNRIYRIKNTSYYLKSHLRTFKACIHMRTAKASIKRIDDEVNYYKRVAQRPVMRSYLNYITRYGARNAIYHLAAKRAIYSLAKKRTPNGWVFVGRLGPDKKNIESARNYNNYLAASLLKVPAKGDLLKSRNQNNIYKSTVVNSKTTTLISTNEVVVVMDVHKKLISGKTEIWVKIAKM